MHVKIQAKKHANNQNIRQLRQSVKMHAQSQTSVKQQVKAQRQQSLNTQASTLAKTSAESQNNLHAQKRVNISQNTHAKQRTLGKSNAQNQLQSQRVDNSQFQDANTIKQEALQHNKAVNSQAQQVRAQVNKSAQAQAKSVVQQSTSPKTTTQAIHTQAPSQLKIVHSQGQQKLQGRWQALDSNYIGPTIKDVQSKKDNNDNEVVSFVADQNDELNVFSTQSVNNLAQKARQVNLSGQAKLAKDKTKQGRAPSNKAHSLPKESEKSQGDTAHKINQAAVDSTINQSIDSARTLTAQQALMALERQSPRKVHSKFIRRPHIPKGRRRFVHISLWKWCLAIFLVILIGAGGVAYKGYTEFKTISSYVVPAQDKPYELKEGATVSKVVHSLADQRYHPLLLDLWVKFNHFNYPVIQKGPYLIDGQKTLSQLLMDMSQGNIVRIKLPTVALIEGMTASMIKKRLLSNKELIQDQQLSYIFGSPSYFIERTLVKDAKDVTLLEAIGGTHNSLEGLLMPATYEYVKDQYSTTYLVQQALIKMATFMREHYIERNHDIDDVITSPYEVLILASLVERESSLESERPLIAGVFLNRLKKNIKLQTDPAVMYGVSPDFKGPLRLSQLKKDTPYNTYTRAGLPPTPIAMPSEEAILAVLNPAETDYLFFVAKGPDPKLGHYFSATLKEHNMAVRKYRNAVSEYKKLAKEKEREAAQAKELAQAKKLEQNNTQTSKQPNDAENNSQHMPLKPPTSANTESKTTLLELNAQ